ncbi:MAG TPA: GatB/YqeY domain-containing protein [Polyangia bacterium]
MSIETQLTEMLKEAMRTKDQATKNVIAMIKTKHMERRTAAGFKGPLDDALWLDVIAAYQKQAKKTRDEYAALGEKGADSLAPLDFEIAFCAKFLPQLAGDDEVRTAVREALTRMSVSDPKQSGRVMGDIMKTNKGKFDPAAVKRIVEEELNKKA